MEQEKQQTEEEQEEQIPSRCLMRHIDSSGFVNEIVEGLVEHAALFTEGTCQVLSKKPGECDAFTGMAEVILTWKDVSLEREFQMLTRFHCSDDLVEFGIFFEITPKEDQSGPSRKASLLRISVATPILKVVEQMDSKMRELWFELTN